MRRRLASLVAAGAATALVLAGCSTGDSDGPTTGGGFEDCIEDPNNCNSGEAQDGGEITWLLDASPDGYFPWSPEGGSVYTLQALYGILPYFGQFLPDGTYEYNMDVLAAEPELVSEDPFQTVFQLSPDAVWDDGTPINAEDVIILWKMSTSADEGHCEGCRPRSSGSFDTIESVEGSDGDKTVTITYKEGISVPEWFAFGSVHGIIGGLPPAHVAGQQGFDIEDPAGLGEYFEYLNDNVPEFSGGPYLIEDFDLDNQIVMVPNPNWYGEEQVTLDRVIKRFISAADTWVPAFQNEEIHGGSPSTWPEDVIRQMLDLDNVRLHMQPGPSWAHVDLNLDNQWLGEHQALRQALFTAIDADDITQRVFGSLFPDATVRTNHVHGPDSEFHVDHLTGTGYGSGDIEAAREILAAAGFEGMDGGAGALTYEGETVGPFRLRSGQSPALVISTELQQAQFAELGIEANIEPTDDLGGTLGSQDYDLMQFGWSGSPLFTGTGGQFWETGGGSNFGNYSNPQVDALIEQERQATSLAESAELHDQMMELVVADAYVLPLYDTPVFIFVSDEYVNVRDNTNSSLRGLASQVGWGVAVQQ